MPTARVPDNVALRLGLGKVSLHLGVEGLYALSNRHENRSPVCINGEEATSALSRILHDRLSTGLSSGHNLSS